MPTKNPRINVAVDNELYRTIQALSRTRGISMSMVTRDLIREAIDIEEDLALADFAAEREETLDSHPTLSHEDTWSE